MTPATLRSCFLLVFLATSAAAQVWGEVTAFGSPSQDEAEAIAYGPDGSVYVAGAFSSPLTIGSTTLPNAGSFDVFVFKRSPVGEIEWAVSAGGGGQDYVGAIAVSPTGRLFIGGGFASQATFGSVSLVSAGGVDLFVTEIDTESGDFLWATGAGSTGGDAVAGLTADSDALFLSGTFDGTVTFGNADVTSQGENDAVLARMTLDGAFEWALGYGGPNDDYGYGVALRPSGSVLVSSWAVSTVMAGDLEIPGLGQPDALLLDVSRGGIVQEGVRVGGTDDDYARDVTVLPDGSTVVTGRFRGTADFLGQSLTSRGEGDIFILSLSSTNELQWVTSFGGTDQDNVYGIDSIGGGVILAGFFRGVVSAGPTQLISEGGDDAYLLALDSDGTPQWALQGGGPGTDRAYAVAASPDGLGGAVGGLFFIQATFGGTTIQATSGGGFDLFLATSLFPDLPTAQAPDARRTLTAAPNPTSGPITVELGGTGPATVHVLDALGRTVLPTKEVVLPSSLTLDVRSLPAGVYILRVVGDDGIVSRRVTVAR